MGNGMHMAVAFAVTAGEQGSDLGSEQGSEEDYKIHVLNLLLLKSLNL